MKFDDEDIDTKKFEEDFFNTIKLQEEFEKDLIEVILKHKMDKGINIRPDLIAFFMSQSFEIFSEVINLNEKLKSRGANEPN